MSTARPRRPRARLPETIVSALVALLLYVVAGLDQWDLAARDLFLRMGPPAAQDTRLLVVDLERWPLPREELARIVDFLTEAGARVIALDVLLDEPRTPEGDRALAEALERSGRVVLPFELEETGDGRYRPLEPLAGYHPAGSGFGAFRVDADRAVRRLEAARAFGTRTLLAFPVRAAMAYHGLSEEEVRWSPGAARLVVGDAIDLPLAASGTFGIRFRRGTGSEPRVPGATWSEFRTDPELAALLVHDRLVFVGLATMERNKDRFPVPGLGLAPTPGVLIHAHAASTVLDGRPVREPSPLAGLLAGIVLGGLLAAGLGPLADRLGPRLGLLPYPVAAVVVLVALACLARTGAWFPPAAALLVLLGAIPVRIYLAQQAQQREVARILDAAVEQARGDDEGEVEERVRRAYPFPIAHAAARLAAAGRSRERFALTMDLFEVALRSLAVLAAADALRHRDSRHVRAWAASYLERPTIGHWNALLRESLRDVGKEFHRLLIPELGAVYRGRTLRQIDNLIQIRNLEEGHGAEMPSGEYRRLEAAVRMQLLPLLASLAALSRYTWIEVGGQDQSASRTGVDCRYLLGESTEFRAGTLDLPRDLFPWRIHLLLPSRTEALPLYPFVEILLCRRHNAKEVCFLNGHTGKGARYLGYQKGCKDDDYHVPDQVEEEVRALLQGETPDTAPRRPSERIPKA